MELVLLSDLPKEIVDCPTVDLVQIFKICLQMATVCVKENGIGLSAVQVGIPWRLFVIRYKNDEFRFFLNCYYTALTEAKEKSLEGCLSIKKNGDFRYFMVDRYASIKVEGYELHTKNGLKLVPLVEEPQEHYRFVFQHEVDHGGWDGKPPTLISEIGVEYEVWDK
jgi:peptide deformylase